MAIEKMKLLSLVGARDEEHAILQELVLCQKIHINLESSETYGNNYIMHEYEAMLPAAEKVPEENHIEIETLCRDKMMQVEKLAVDLQLDLNVLLDQIKSYSREQALADLQRLQEKIGPNIESVIEKRKQVAEINELNKNLSYFDREVDFTILNSLHYIKYEVGLLSRENRLHIRRNYENISALVFQVGEVEESKEDLYIVFYLEDLEEETHKLLKSLNWHRIQIDGELREGIESCKLENEKKLEILKRQISVLEKDIFETKSDLISKLSKIYSRMKLELRILELREHLLMGNNVFVLDAWIRARDYKQLEERIANITDKYVLMARKPSELGDEVLPPTLLKNNRLVRPFEMIVKLYGLPSYYEIDPTPFLAITFCLMFGIMFGDIGQGFVYFLAGFLIAEKIPVASGILKRLGMSSMIFGVVYGSVFGLEEIPILSDIALVHGGPLNRTNIMPVLIAGIVFGVGVLSISFFIGIINALRRKDMESAFFGKNGIAGYIFFIGLMSTVLSIVGILPLPVIVPILIMILMLLIMVFKEPLIHLIEGSRPLIKGDKGSYYIESGFEGVETILSTLSNSISFIRVGAFALNHAGLFMAFKVMAEMVPGMATKLMILILGNVLILTLEGLVVFIQGLRLQYYEMFSKYFDGDGIAYNPLKIEK